MKVAAAILRGVGTLSLSILPLIAVVDDDPAMRQALADLLEVFEFECRAFEGAAEFTASYARGRFSCLITDLDLVSSSGLDLLKQVKAAEPDLPVIIVSAQDVPELRAQAERAGAQAYLVKPLDHQVLLKLLGAARRPSRRPTDER